MDLGQPWYIPPEDITLLEVIATGTFATIYKAKWKETPKNVKQVVAKVLEVRENQDEIVLMLAKINFAATKLCKHKNLLGFLGAVMENEAYNFKRRRQVAVHDPSLFHPLSRNSWISIRIPHVSTVWRGGISCYKIVHHKLAARKCLLTSLLAIKVSGCHPIKADESPDDENDGISLIKWTAPECFISFKDASEKSDAWSYGVTLWEIFSMGEKPYSAIKVRDIPTKIKGEHRLSRPEYAEDIHYRLMQECWSESPSERPVFSRIVGSLESSFRLQQDEPHYSEI